MADITSLGLISGLNVQDIIDKLVALEQKKIKDIQTKEADYNVKISTYGELASKLNDLRSTLGSFSINTNNFLTAQSNNTNIITASVGLSPQEGSYQIKVNQLAQSQSMYSKSYSSLDDIIGTGTLSITINGNANNITIDSSNNTVSGVVNAINNSSADMKATTIFDGTGYRIIVTGKNTGIANSITIGTIDDDGNNTDLNGLSALVFNGTTNNMTLTRAAANAIIEINGITVENSSNTITNAIPGVTLTLKNTSTELVTVDIIKDTSTFKSKINKFVENYNNAIKAIQGYLKKGGLMTSESAVRSINESLRNMLLSNFDGKTLLSFGITHDKYGILSIDEQKIDNLLQTDFSGVKTFFNNVSSSFSESINKLNDLYINKRNETLQTLIDTLKDRESIETTRIEEYRKRLVKQFTAMEQALAQLQTSSTYLTNQINSLNNKK